MSLFSKIAARFQRPDPRVTAAAVGMAESLARLCATADDALSGLEDVLRNTASLMAEVEHGRKLSNDDAAQTRRTLNTAANTVSQFRAASRQLGEDIEAQIAGLP